MMKKIVVALVIVALVSSGFTYAILRLYPEGTNSQNIGTDYQTEIQNLNSSFEQLGDAFEGLKASLAKLSSDLNDSNESLRLDLLEANEDIVTIQNNISSFQQAIAGLQNQFVAAQSRLNTTENGLNDVQTQMESLSEVLSSVEANVSELADKVLVLTANATQISEDLADLKSTMNTIQGDVSSLKTSMQTVQTQIATILMDLSSLQTKMSELEGRIDTLNQSKSTVIRVNIEAFVPNRRPPGEALTGEDWLIDCRVALLNGTVLTVSRTGHSRFFGPRYLDSSILGIQRNQIIGQQVKITLVAYWHLSDTCIDINPNTHWPENWGRWAHDENALVLYYTVGTRIPTQTVEGYGKNWLVWHPSYSYGTFTYSVLTF